MNNTCIRTYYSPTWRLFLNYKLPYLKTVLYGTDKESSVLTQTVINHLILYPTPISINYLWGFGSLAGLTLAIQILTGCLLAMHYTPHIVYAFDSVEHLMRDVSYGWLLRYTHANGASMFFIVVYIHICRGLFYGSYNEPRRLLWLTGVIIFFLMIITAFVGYVLPWGQMSLWGATVITSLCSSIPLVGQPILVWFWGGFSVDNPTLNRFFSLHYLLPFIITGVVLIHLVLLHVEGSSEPSGGTGNSLEYMPFYPYFYNKDLFGFMIFVLVFSLLVFFAPNALGHSDNYIVANPMVTPEHIVPEWYFLSYYAILRAVPDKLAGVICMVFAIVCLGIIYLFSQSEIKPIDFQPTKKLLAVAIICLNAILAWLGQCEAVYPFVQVGQFTEVLYFGVFLLCLPFLNLVDTLYYRNSVQRLYTEFLYVQYLLFMRHRADRFRLGDLEEYRRKVMYRVNQKRLFRLGNVEDQESHWFNHFLLLAERTKSPLVRELIQNFGIYMRWADRAVWRKFSLNFYLKSLKMYRTLKGEIDPYQL